MDSILDILLFRTYITPWVLLFMYYMGAVVMPIAAFVLARRWWKRLPRENIHLLNSSLFYIIARGGHDHWLVLRTRLILVMLAMFVMAQVGWRMLFEFGFAYFQMHEALQRLAG